MTLRNDLKTSYNALILNTEGMAESGTVRTVAGATLSILFTRGGISELANIDPGFADTQSFRTSKTYYPDPKPGDVITDADGVSWIVETNPLGRTDRWVIPVKSDRRVRA